MLKTLAVAVLTVGLVGCGGDEDRLELVSYVNNMKQLDDKHREITQRIEILDDPSNEITASDLQEARQIIDSYIAEIEKTDPTEMKYRPLRIAYTSHFKKLTQAAELAKDQGKELRRERGNVAIGVRHIEKTTRLHFTALDVLWLRQKVKEPFPLKWPE
jgi:hypothetical protein